MCGICGVVASDERTAHEYDLARFVRPMMMAMWHRGPDEAGHLEAPGIALGMRRLSIVDRETSTQPMYNEDRTIAVVTNGEIYNFAALRRELIAHGHHFRSRGDTETIVHAYEQWGEAFPTHLRGMFALAIYDAPRRRLLLARDRLGIKPLYYTQVNGRLLFASEVRALLASGLVARELSRDGLESYLLFGSVSEPATLIEGVRSLLPGHMLQVPVRAFAAEAFAADRFASDASAWRALASSAREAARAMPSEPQTYWTLPRIEPAARNGGRTGKGAESANGSASSDAHASAPHGAVGVGVADQAPAHGTPQGPARELRALLEDSVDLHLVSDEPLGVFLSGGVDSTTIAALASRARAGVRCYTIAFREREFDESEVARRTAQRLGVEHQELLVDPREMLDGLDAALGALDQPSVDGINTYCVSAAVRRAGAKVALSGLGGDELFGGYRTFRWMPTLDRLSAVARWTPRLVRHASAHAIDTAGAWTHRCDQTDRLASLWREPDALPHPFFFARTVFGPGEVDRLSSDGTSADCDWRRFNDDTVRMAHGLDRFGAVSCFELRSYMLNTLLRDADTMSMAHSLELRVPLLDHPIVEFVAAQAAGVMERHGAYKPLLVDALGDLLPREVSERPKRGFTFPWARWMCDPLAPRVSARLRDLAPALDAHLDRREVASTWTAFQSGRNGWLRPWSLFILDDWARRHL